MTTFSEEFQKLLRERDTRIYILAEESGIDRTLIHKFIKGERLPANRAAVQRLSGAMLLTPDETSRLTQSYFRSKLGEEACLRQMHIAELLNDFDKTSSGGVSVQAGYRHRITVPPDNAAVYGTLEINHLLKTAVEMEAAKGAGTLRIVAQPEYAFLTELLALTGRSERGLTIEQVVCLENASGGSGGLYNLDCFRAVLPIFLSGCNYRPMCYHDHVPSHLNSTSVLPYFLLTSDYVIHFSCDISYATISANKDCLKLYSTIFYDFIRKSAPVFTIMPIRRDGPDSAPLSAYGPPDFYLSDRPCLPLLPPDEARDQPSDRRPAQRQNTRDREQSPPKHEIRQVFFSERGLDCFLGAEVLPNAAESVSAPADTAGRYAALKELYDRSLSGNFHPLITNPLFFRIPECLSVAVFPHAVALTAAPAGSEPRICFVEESSLVRAFYDFFKSLPESNFVLSEEETLDLLKRKLEQRAAD